MTLGDGFPAVSGTVDSTELRKALAGLILRDTSGNARAGVFPRHTSALVSSKASMAVDVAAFEGVTVRGGGPIFMANDGTVSVSVDAAPVSNSRIDVVYFKQNESASPYSDANNLPVIAIAKGTAGAVPVKPTIPPGATELATILIPSGVSATNAGGVVITQTFQYTALTGALLWVRNSTERGALPTLPVGTTTLQLDTSMSYRWSGSAWISATDSVTLVPWTALTTVSSLNIDSLTGFGQYEIILDLPTSSVANMITTKLRASGAADSSAAYDFQYVLGAVTSVVGEAALAQTSWFATTGNRADKFLTLRLTGLNESQRTIGHLDITTADASANILMQQLRLRHRTASAFNGVGFTVTTGTVTGRYMVRGIGPN